MRGPIVLLLTLVAAIGGWMFFQDLPVNGLGRRQGSDPSEPDTRSTLVATGAPLKRPGDSIHIASFNIQMFGRTKASKPHVMDMLASYAPNIREKTLSAELLTPEDMENEFRMTGGHWHHGELSLDQFLMLRPVPKSAQYNTPVEGLYLCGAGCHPGGGVMGSAGRNAANALLAE